MVNLQLFAILDIGRYRTLSRTLGHFNFSALDFTKQNPVSMVDFHLLLGIFRILFYKVVALKKRPCIGQKGKDSANGFCSVKKNFKTFSNILVLFRTCSRTWRRASRT